MADPPIGLVNRCRIVRIVQDIERIDKLEADEPTIRYRTDWWTTHNKSTLTTECIFLFINVGSLRRPDSVIAQATVDDFMPALLK